jgi:hypothetical protein
MSFYVKRVEIPVEKLLGFKSRGIDQILVEPIRAEATALCSKIHKLIFMLCILLCIPYNVRISDHQHSLSKLAAIMWQ